MPVAIARDSTATDQLVYAWPFPLGPDEIDVTCGEDEVVVMCPSWLVGDRLGPGRHRWRTPDPSRPVGAYFVSTAPVETSFDVTTSFVIPASQQTATLRAQGSIIVRCVDPGLLIAQFVGLPFDDVNAGLLRSVTRSAERLIARILTRRTVMAQTAVAVTDPGMLQSIVDEMVAYNPAAGAVFGVEFVRLTGLYITTGDAGWNTNQIQINPSSSSPDGWQVDAQGSQPRWMPQAPEAAPQVLDGRAAGSVSGEIGRKAPPANASVATAETQKSPAFVLPPPTAAEPERGDKADPARRTVANAAVPPPVPVARPASSPGIAVNSTPSTPPPIPRAAAQTLPPPVGGAAGGPPPPMPITPPASASAALADPKKRSTLQSVPPPAPQGGSSPGLAAITPRPRTPTAPGAVPIPAVGTSTSGAMTSDRSSETAGEIGAKSKPRATTDGGSAPVIGIGMGGIGIGATPRPSTDPPARPAAAIKAAEPDEPEKLDKGAQVRVAGPDGRLVAATVKQELSGYYELEIGGTNEVVWVPRSSVITE